MLAHARPKILGGAVMLAVSDSSSASSAWV
jgi:hypothetical protein